MSHLHWIAIAHSFLTLHWLPLLYAALPLIITAHCHWSFPHACCPPALPFAFIIVPWHLISLFVNTICWRERFAGTCNDGKMTGFRLSLARSLCTQSNRWRKLLTHDYTTSMSVYFDISNTIPRLLLSICTHVYENKIYYVSMVKYTIQKKGQCQHAQRSVQCWPLE